MIDLQPSEGFEWTQEPWGPALRCSPLGDVAPHLFTIGNLRLVDDEQEWAAVAQRMRVGRQQLCLIHQVHGADVAVIRAGEGCRSNRPHADIIVSDDPHVAIAVRVADCTPVLLADRRLGVVGAAHAGWRGIARGAARRAVEAMCDVFGSQAQDLTAAIGPCLGPCCGEMGPEVVDEFRKWGWDENACAAWFTSGIDGRPHLDMWKANRDQLSRAGLPASRIHVAEICTKTHSSYLHSYRAQGRHAGRMAAIIRARESVPP